MIKDAHDFREVKSMAVSLPKTVMKCDSATWCSVGVATTDDGVTDFQTLFAVPMWICISCVVALLVYYPGRSTADTRSTS